MTEAIVVFLKAAGILVPVFAAWWVWQDANRLKKEGVDVNPILWAMLVLLFCLMSLPLYLLLRQRRSLSGPSAGKIDAGGPVVLGVIAFLGAIVLAMVVTWILIARYPFPDDGAIALGLLGFCVVMFSDLILMYLLIGPEVRKGESIEAAKLSARFILVGLLVASFVGVLPWCFSWLVNRYPWLPSLFPYSFVVLVIAELIWSWKLRRARGAT